MTVTSEGFLDLCALVTLAALALALIAVSVRIIRGPTLPDRIVALDLLVGIVIGFIATVSLWTGYTYYLDVALALGLVGFLTTVAFARFVMRRGQAGDAANTLPDTGEARHAEKTP